MSGVWALSEDFSIGKRSNEKKNISKPKCPYLYRRVPSKPILRGSKILLSPLPLYAK